MLIYKDQFVFTGDHLEYDEDVESKLRAFKDFCWYDWNEQIAESMKQPSQL